MLAKIFTALSEVVIIDTPASPVGPVFSSAIVEKPPSISHLTSALLLY